MICIGKKIRLIKQVVIIFLLLPVNSSIFSETITKRIGRNFFTLDTDTSKLIIENYQNLPVKESNNRGPQRSINDELLAILESNKVSNNYEYIIFNCQNGNILTTHYFNNENRINGNIRDYYFTSKKIYTVVDERIIIRSLDGEIIMNKTINDPEFNMHTLKYFIIDEQNEVAICEFNYKGDKQRICIYSLTDKFDFKEYFGKLLFKNSKETNKLYYSDTNDIFCVDYKEDFNTTKIKVQKRIGEKIIELVEFGNTYIMVTKKNYFESFATNIILGNESFRNYYYLCCLDNEKIKIQEKIYKDEEEPEIFWK